MNFRMTQSGTAATKHLDVIWTPASRKLFISHKFQIVFLLLRQAGGDIMSPVFSARVWTRGTFDFAFGRIEIRAKLPRGDWLWPGWFSFRFLKIHDFFLNSYLDVSL